MWQMIRTKLPVNVQGLFLRVLLVLLLLTATRILFFFYNYDSFSNVRVTDWLAGAWFDLATLSLVWLPFIVFSLLPIQWQSAKWLRAINLVLFILPVTAMIGLNLLDTEYFNFTQKRSTADLFAIVSAGNDIGQLLTSFIRDFWFLIVAFIFLLYGLLWVYRRTNFHHWNTTIVAPSLQKELLFFSLLLPLFILFGRGGTSLKPIAAIDATLYTEPQNTALILNSAFTFLKSIGKDDLIEKNYFSVKQSQKMFHPIQSTQPQHILPNKTNVMIIMLESFGNEWVGTFNHDKSYTPFLDSLLTKSWYFEYGISNGKKSIEAVPCILASIPTWMDNPYISSAYGANTINSLPAILKKQGYSSAFFHGATNGSMRFNSFAKKLGFDAYVGRKEYNNDAHFDRTWGILDEYFNPWTAKQLTKMKAPFCATLFTLSSHHPYYVPPNWRKKLKSGPHPICKSIAYGDMSLALFFKQAQKEPWYNNTLFVLVADHTPSTESTIYSERSQMYQIPIAFFDPSGKLPRKKEKVIFQQSDIFPTVLDLLNVTTNFYAFGHSFFSTEPREALAYLEGSYYYFQKNKMLVFAHDKPTHLIDFTQKTKKQANVLKQHVTEGHQMERRLKAIIQRYNHDLIHNKTRVK
jgi:phosphoglycerol transferase MdoB-like AlkP superfamily enzyme